MSEKRFRFWVWTWFWLLIIGLIFAFYSESQAQTVIYDGYSGATNGSANSSNSVGGVYFTPNGSYVFDQVNFSHGQSATTTSFVRIYSMASSTDNLDLDDYIAQSETRTNTINEFGVKEYIFPTSVGISSVSDYAFVIFTSNNVFTLSFQSVDSNSEIWMDRWNSTTGNFITQSFNDPYFQLLASSGATSTQILNISNPDSNETVSNNVDITVDIFNGLDSATEILFSFEQNSQNLIPVSQNLIESGNITVTQPYNFQNNGTVWMTVSLLDSDGEIIDSELTFFHINQASDFSPFDQPEITFCSAPSGLMEEAVCYVLEQIQGLFSFLFIPSIQSTTQFSNLKDQMTTKFPIAYFSDIQEIWSNATTTSGMGPTLSLDLPALTGTGTTTYTFFSLSATESYFPGADTLFDLFRLLLQTGLWVSLLVFLYHSVRNTVKNL